MGLKSDHRLKQRIFSQYSSGGKPFTTSSRRANRSPSVLTRMNTTVLGDLFFSMIPLIGNTTIARQDSTMPMNFRRRNRTWRWKTSAAVVMIHSSPHYSIQDSTAGLIFSEITSTVVAGVIISLLYEEELLCELSVVDVLVALLLLENELLLVSTSKATSGKSTTRRLTL